MELNRDWILAAAVTALAAAPTAMAQSDAERIRILEEQLQQQQQMLQQMQAELQRLKAAGVSADAVTVPVEDLHEPVAVASAPKELDAETVLGFDIYGFVMADAIYDFNRVDPDWNDTLRVSTIPTTEGLYGEDGEFIFSVRQSRLGFKGDWDTDAGKVTALFEWELFGTGGDAGQTTPRLRHAWGTWKNFGMGQYWSNFMDADVFPNTIDYWGPTGMVFYRNKQARYTFPMGDNEFAVSLEDPSTALTVGKFRDDCTSDPNCDSLIGDVFQAKNDVPDLVARYRSNNDWGHWQLAGIARKLGFERTDTGDTDSEFGWGLNASSVVKINDLDRLKLQVVYGEGIGNYMNDGGIDIAPKNAELADNRAEVVPLLGIVAYYDHYWNERWSTSVGWSTTRLDTTDGQAFDEFETGQIAQVNLLHYPTDGVLVGGELIWGEREEVDGVSVDDLRVQMSLKVNFPR
ncbi:hypothetical protein A3709_04650 [Halioglobus sp. HI00S01]|uniref:DcaP family trimeric outer membrane transporter n=1 Tax=Halioglobus sp. HI00S01 TaxID=1822214 RepID=UPI0007C2C6F5|nr:DcaP family trimeric outer membrane transporter [Halioglobus sp. HI00S01]KZX57060.1 hypothetical protein A3709_04650 [Halioglobus sp. HI00S01]